MIWAKMGSGKTALGLFFINHLLKHKASRGALIIGPLWVVQSVWEQEARMWRDLQKMQFALLHGSKAKISRLLCQPHDVWLCNYESLPKLAALCSELFLRHGIPLPFDTLIADEVPRLKSMRVLQGGMRANALRTFIGMFKYRVGLTGTPAPNGLEDLFGQYLALDGGYRLGTSFTTYRERWFRPTDYHGYRYEPTEAGARDIYNRIADITFQLSTSEENQLPVLAAPNDIVFELPQKARKLYNEMEKELYIEFFSTKRVNAFVEVEATTKAAMQNKCLQLCAGAVYPYSGQPDKWEPVHKVKLDILEDIITETGDTPLLVGYAYRHEAARIYERLGRRYSCAFPSSKMSKQQKNYVIQQWNEKKIKLLCGHPASMGHGLNLQRGSHIIVWLSLTRSLELYAQLIARLHRQGQEHPVEIHRILADDTFETGVVVEALARKEYVEQQLQEEVRKLRMRGASDSQVMQYQTTHFINEEVILETTASEYLRRKYG